MNTINVAKYRIDLDINQLQFSYHYLFSEEHVLAFKLNTMYDHYKITEEQNLIEILTERVRNKTKFIIFIFDLYSKIKIR